MKLIVPISGVAVCLLGIGLVIGCDKSPTTSDHIAGPRFAAVGPVSQLVFTVQPSTAVAGAAITPAVQVTAQDAQGNTVTTYTAKITVALATNPSNAKLGGMVTMSAKSGVATFSNLSITNAATGYALRATSGTLTAATSSPFDIMPGPASKIVFTVQPTPTAAGDPITPAVQVSAEDAFNNVATSFVGSISLTLKSCSAGAILSGTSMATAQNGVASFADLSINKSGNCSLKATSGSFTATSATFVIGPALPASLQFLVQPSKTKAGVAMSPTVKVTARDQFGNTASGFNGQVMMSIASGPVGVPLLGTTTVTAVSGTASFANLIIQKVGSYALQASATGLSAATSTGFLVVPNSPTHLAFTVQPSATAPGAVITPPVQVMVRDAYDNPVPITGGVTLAIGSNPGGGTLSGTLTKSAAATGVAIFDDLSINSSGAGYTLIATLGILPSATSASFDIGFTPTQLVFTAQPSNTAVGTTIAPAVQVTAKDAFGNTATGFSGNVSIAIGTNPAGGSLYGAQTVAAVAGVATYSDLSIDVGGSGYTLQAASIGLTSATSNTFDILVPPPQVFAAVSAGEHHTCGLTTDGKAYCWGDNTYGQIGDGTNIERTRPVLVSGGMTFASISAGTLKTCGVTTAGGAYSGAAYCWGRGDGGGLGNGTTTDANVPALVLGGLAFATVSATGQSYSCGVSTAGGAYAGAAYCWGFGAFYTLGTGNNSSSTQPVLVTGGLTFASISTGSQHSCGLTTSGEGYCWGQNGLGQIGDGTTSTAQGPVPISGGAYTFASLSAGGFHTCGVTSAGGDYPGAAYCWGAGNLGQLGNGIATESGIPTPVPSEVVDGLTFASITGGSDYTCAVTTQGAAYCWGDGTTGALGNNTFTNMQTTPVAVSGSYSFVSLSAGLLHVCGVTTAAETYCWGSDLIGELGQGSNERINKSSPQLVVVP